MNPMLKASNLPAALWVWFVACSFAAQITSTAVPISSARFASTTSPLIAVDPSGNIYIVGDVRNNVAATPGAFQTRVAKDPVLCPNLSDGSCITPFVAKLDPTGTKIIYLTYLTGDGSDYISSIAVDAQGSVYAAGWTSSRKFPGTANSLRKFSPHAWPAFIVKLNPAGSDIEYGALIGGSQGQPVSAVAVDPARNAYIIGTTESTDFPVTPGAFQTSPGPAGVYGDHGFIAKLNASGSALVYSSYIAAAPRAIAVGNDGQAYVTGQSWGQLPTTQGVMQTRNNGSIDAFVMNIGPEGNLRYSTYVGGPAKDSAFAIAVDHEGSAYVTGDTRDDDLNSLVSPQFPVTPGAFQTVFDGGFGSGHRGAAVVFKLSPDGSSLVYSTYLTGGLFESGHAIAVTPQGEAIVMGFSQSINFPTTPDAYSSIGPSSVEESFLTYIDAAGQKLKYSTHISGAGLFAMNPGGSVVYTIGELEDGSSEIARVDLAATPPPLFLSGIGNAASYEGRIVVPGEIVTLVGAGIGPEPPVSAVDFLGSIGTSTGGVQVFFDEIAAPVLYAAANQINAQAPFELAGRSMVQVKVRYGGRDSNAIALQVSGPVPGLFTISGRGSGQAAVLNQNGTINSPANPAARGSIVSFFLTGAGVTKPASVTGHITPLAGQYLLPGPVTLGFGSALATRVTYAGAAPGLISGVVQVNAQIPREAEVGDAILLFMYIGKLFPPDFQSGLTIAIR